MGVLIIRQVKYEGDNYQYQSPVLSKGLNVIYGDNGSGKSTFSYFIEYALGGKVAPFNKDQQIDKYKKIIEDTNNFIQLEIAIDDLNYSVKRFMQESDIFIEHNGNVIKLPIYRHGESKIFSDWILEKLAIPNFEMNLGTTHWIFGFSDLFRLLNYDQDTEDKKIYKAPPIENFITESIIVRKSIFEILLGISSTEYFKKHDELKLALKKRDIAKSLLDGFKERYQHLNFENPALHEHKKQMEAEISTLIIDRDQFLKEKTNVPAKFAKINELQQSLLALELKVTDEQTILNGYSIEQNKVSRLYEESQRDISQLQKIIFTHDKLDLFKMEVCPFCATDKPDIQEGYCICGSKFNTDDYEKFVYSSGEYKDILKHKEKSIEAIEIAKESYDQKIEELHKSINKHNEELDVFKSQLKDAIINSEFTGNTSLIEAINIEIFRLKDELYVINKNIDIYNEHIELKTNFQTKNTSFNKLSEVFRRIKADFEKNNAATIMKFNFIYNDLLSKSSHKSLHAQINDDYMPVIDHGDYHQASAGVPRRLMYFFTILSMALKYPSVKHPKFLLIDTPENSGIDREMLKTDISLLKRAIELASTDPVHNIPDYQVILTIGYDRLPAEFEQYVVERFNTTSNTYILRSREIKV